jgi:phosphoserine phosphatase
MMEGDMQTGELRRFKDHHRRYPGATLLVLEVLEMDTRYTTQTASVTFLVNGIREFGWSGELLENVTEPVDAAR